METITRIPEQAGLYDDPKEVGVYADEMGRGFVAFIERLFARMILNRFGQSPLPLRVLDMGTGPGWIPAMLGHARPTWDITALDASTLMLEQARKNAAKKHASIQFINAKAEKTGLPSNQFDLIISHFAFSEFPDGPAVVNEIERLLSPQGVVLIQDLVRPQAWQMPILKAWRYLTNPFGKINQQYLSSLQGAYSIDELKALFASSGLGVDVMPVLGGGIARVVGRKQVQQNYQFIRTIQ